MSRRGEGALWLKAVNALLDALDYTLAMDADQLPAASKLKLIERRVAEMRAILARRNPT